MAIRAKVDEDLPAEVADRLREAGHDARSVVEQSLSGTPDDRLWNIACDERRWLITADKGLAAKWALEANAPDGVVLFRLPRESRAGYLRLIELLLSEFSFEGEIGSIVVVTPDAIRIRRRESDI